MKLILCPKCQDVVKCGHQEKRYCQCGKSWGMYIDNLYAEIGGNAIPVCLSNSGLVDSILSRPQRGRGQNFTAWVPPVECDTIKTVNTKRGQEHVKRVLRNGK